MGGGPSQAVGSGRFDADAASRCFDLDTLDLRDGWLRDFAPDALAGSSVFDWDVPQSRDALQVRIRALREARGASRSGAGKRRTRRGGNGSVESSLLVSEDRAIGALLGLVMGDALGAPLEFSAVRYDDGAFDLDLRVSGFAEDEPWTSEELNRFRLRPGQWTDDTSMALCLADSLLAHRGFEPRDLRLRFANWWQFGYNNAFANDLDRRRGKHGGSSVGLGSNIGESLLDFATNQAEYTRTGDRWTSGNGGIMRLAPVAVFFHRDPSEALRVAALQSRTTHRGDEAAECARLLAHILVFAVGHPAAAATARAEVLGGLGESFPHESYAGACLAGAQAERQHPDNDGVDLAERDWQWQSDVYRYGPARTAEDPGYIGSYAMDALAMALHCTWTTHSFEAAVLKAANLRGDADTVAAIAGQIAGALYGASAIPAAWLDAVQRWDGGGSIALRAHRLFRAKAEVT